MIKTEPMRICGTMHGYPCFQHHTTPLGGPLTRSAASSVALSSFATSLRTVKTIRKRISEHPNHPTSDLLHRPWMSQSVAKLLRYVRTRSHARTHQLKPATRPPALWMMSATHRGPSPRERSSQIVCSANAVIVIVVVGVGVSEYGRRDRHQAQPTGAPRFGEGDVQQHSLHRGPRHPGQGAARETNQRVGPILERGLRRRQDVD